MSSPDNGNEMQEQNQEKTEVSAIDFLLNSGEDSLGQSPESESGIDEIHDKAQCGDAGSEVPENNKDSAAGPESSSDAGDEVAKLKEENERLKKRFHDTQSAYHGACKKKAELEKKLSSLEAKREDADDFFSESDEAEVEKLKVEIEEQDKNISSIMTEEENQVDTSKWDSEVEKLKDDCPDFESVVYEQFCPLVGAGSSEKINPQVQAEFNALKDKSPKSVYEFARRTLDVLEFQKNPEAYKAKILAESRKQNQMPNERISETPTGKRGLDMQLSANCSEPVPLRRSFVDELLG